jgi:crossover junction endodeoxyribonuclease RuvC
LKASRGGLLKKAEKRVLPAGGAGPGAAPGRRRIIGVDPGLASTGWGVVEYADSRLRYIAHGCIETPASEDRGERLLLIYQSFVRILTTYQPAEGAMENLYFGRNISSAMAVAEARGVLSMALARQALPVMELTPNAIKKAVVGESSADKSQIQEMVRLILGLAEIPRPDHAADALGAAICAAHLGGVLSV